MNIQGFLEKTADWSLSSGIHITLIVILMWVAPKVAKKFPIRLVQFISRQKDNGEFLKRTQTLGHMVRYVLVLAILAVGIMTALKEFGIDIGPVVAAAGIVGLAVGFGAQSLVKDVISGLFILLEN